MLNIKDIAIYGTDQRQEYLKKHFASAGVSVAAVHDAPPSPDLSACQNRDPGFTVLLPVPCPDDLLEYSLDTLKPGNTVLGGNFPDYFMEACRDRNIFVYDYMKCPSIAILNAVATAEGVICEAIQHSPENLHKSDCLVIGYGRCGSVLADKLRGLNSQVTVLTPDSTEAARAQAMGYQIFTPQTNRRQFRFLFNTAPAPVVDADMIDSLHPDITILDIASKPGGTDFNYCKKLGIRAFHCPGLPARYAPKSSADIIFQRINEVFNIE